jgi:hypothetical protein
MRAEAAADLHPAMRPVVLVGSVRSRFGLLVEAALGFSQPRPPALTGPQLLGQLVAAGVTVELALARAPGLGLLGPRSPTSGARSRRSASAARSTAFQGNARLAEGPVAEQATAALDATDVVGAVASVSGATTRSPAPPIMSV